ncbi:hypothetical protein [Micromonospora pallida]|uniref:hypothetical protein n=1 Tax=Micromonospora pallida TaxID=145854 RepID=UPI00114C9FC3|nr:hypothetical protein [Micromonospora pallida]
MVVDPGADVVPTTAVGLVEQLGETLGTPTGEEVAVHRRHLLSLVTVVRPLSSPVGRLGLVDTDDRRGRRVADDRAVPAAADGGSRWDAGRRESWRAASPATWIEDLAEAGAGRTRRNGR